MRKNRLMWNIALFLIIIIALPVAYAQTATASWFYVLINAAIVFVILFALQTFLIPGKADKEKTAVYAILIGGSLLIGLLFGRDGLIYNTGIVGAFFRTYIWYVILVNALIITAVLYFVLGLLDKNKRLMPGSPQGISGVGILLFLISIVFAVKLGNRWIWQLENVQYFINYLFGVEGILVYPKIIVFITSFVVLAYFFTFYFTKEIAGAKFITYALAAILAASMASAGVGLQIVIRIAEFVFLIVLADALDGKIKDGHYKWGLAFLIVGWSSASLTAAFGPEYSGIIGSFMAPMLRYYGLIRAEPGATTGFAPLLLSAPVLVAVVILFVMDIVGTGRWKTIGKGGVISWGILLFLTGGISLGLGKFGTIGMWVLIPVVIVVALLFIVGRAGKRSGEKWKKLKKYGIGPFMRALRSSPIAPLRWIAYLWQGKDPYIEGRLPLVFKDLRFELMTLMNYQTRLHTYLGKKNAVVEFKNQALGIEQHFASAPKTYDRMRRSLDTYRLGKEGIVEGKEMFGWSNNDVLIDEFFKALSDALSVTRTMSYQTGAIAVQQPLRQRMDSMLEKMNVAYEQYLSNVKRVGLIHRLKSLRISLVDLLALYGVYKHYYRFASEKAIFELWYVKIDDNIKRDKSGKAVPDEEGNPKKTNEDVLWSATPLKRVEKYEKIVEGEIEKAKDNLRNSLTISVKKDLDYDERIKHLTPDQKKQLDIEVSNRVEDELKTEKNWNEIVKLLPKKFKLGYVANLEGVGPIRHEVDIKGFVLADFHSIEVDRKEGKYVRRVKLRDIEEFPSDAPELAKHSWIATQIEQEWTFLLQDLRWGQFHPYSRSDVDYTKIISTQRIYEFSKVGRTRPNKDQQKAAFDLEALKIPHLWVYWGRRNYWDTSISSRNPYPTISTVGISRFITALVRLRNKENIADKYLSTYVWDTGRDDKPFTTIIGKEVKEQSGR